VRGRVTLVREIGISAQRGTKVTYGSDLVDGVILQGLTANAGIMTNTQIDTGRYFTEIEDQRHLAVVVLGADVKDRFFPTIDPLGKIVGVDGLPFEVIGVAKPKGAVFGQSQDNFVAIPSETYFKIYGAKLGLNYNFLAVDRGHLEQAQDEVRVLVRSFRHLRPLQDDNFAIVSSDTLVATWDQLTGVIAAVAVAVVSVFMVVGGVVIMNIMLAVVSERTREIGVRKSVGARRQDILNQFLVESSMLAGCGGLAGVALAWIAAVVVRNFTPVPMEVPAAAVIMGVTLSTAVGLFFGIYPARQAALLDPIVALRAEN
jgi:putative ABC transport system permease protein